MKKILVAFVVAILLLSGCSGAPSDPVSIDEDALLESADPTIQSESSTPEPTPESTPPEPTLVSTTTPSPTPEPTAAPTTQPTEKPTAQPTEKPAPTPADTPQTVTTGQRNALGSAKQYLNVMAFSHKGLVEQLEYEGYSHEEAVYGADNCSADWNAQAAKKAKLYLEIMSFSRSGLIDQLKYDGFTQAQAEYGVSQNGY